MFKKINKNKIIQKNYDEYDINLKDNDNDEEGVDKIVTDKCINKIKEEINKKSKKIPKGVEIKESENDEKIILAFKKEENRQNSIKKVFISEITINDAKNVEQKNKLLGMKREEVEKINFERKKGLFEMEKDLFKLPTHLNIESNNTIDHAENLMKLSKQGLIEVTSLPVDQSFVDNTSIAYSGNKDPSYWKKQNKIDPLYYLINKDDINYRKPKDLDDAFGNVFLAENSRKRKLNKEKIINDNRKSENN